MVQPIIAAAALLEISEHEAEMYNLKSNDRIQSLFKELGFDLKKDVSALTLDDGLSNIIIKLKGRPDVNVSLTEPGVWSEQVLNRLANVIIHAGPIWKCIPYTPTWYRYWIFRYLENKSLDGLEFTQRLSPEHLEAGFEVTAIVPSYITRGNHVEMKQAVPAVRRLRFVQTSADDKKNMAIGEIHPFIICGNRYGFNQVIPMPHYQALCEPNEDYEAVNDKATAVFWTN